MEIQRTNPHFSCCACGLCCRHVDRLPEMFSDHREELDRGDGVCRFLDLDTNLCSIYETRPILCRVDDFYDDVLKDKLNLPRSEWYRMNHQMCEELKNEDKEK